MNKRFVEFFNELAEENEQLESKCRNVLLMKEMMLKEILEQKKQIKELKATVRKLRIVQK
jgi:hypothetical protein